MGITNRTSMRKTQKMMAAGLATLVVVTANLLAMEAEYASVSDAAKSVEGAVPSAPALIDVEAFAPPTVADRSLESLELTVPELRRPDLGEPALGRLYEQVRAGRSPSRVIAAPTAELVADPPELDLSGVDEGPALQIPALERPELPAPPRVR